MSSRITGSVGASLWASSTSRSASRVLPGPDERGPSCSGSVRRRRSLPMIERSTAKAVCRTFHPPSTGPSTFDRGTSGVGDEHLVEVTFARDLPDRADFDSRLLHGEPEQRDPSVLRQVPVRPCQEQRVVGVLGAGGPDLLAVDDIGVTVQVGPRPESGEVGTGARFGVQEAAAQLVGEQASKELPFELVGSERRQRDRPEVALLLLGSGCTSSTELLCHDRRRSGVIAPAVPRRRPGGDGKPGVDDPSEPVRRGQVVRPVLGEP